MTTEPVNPEVYPEDQAWLDAQLAELTLGRRLKAHRQCQGWTQAEVARRMGITKQLLSAYETGRKHPSIGKAVEMAQVLGMLPEAVVLSLVNDQLRAQQLPFQFTIAG